MNNKHKITVSLSIVLALVFSLPWITLIDQVRSVSFRGGDPPVLARVIYMFITVFVASMALFTYNFFWKYSVEAKIRLSRMAVTTIVNIVSIIVISLLFVMFASLVFDIKAFKAYFMVYFFRNLFIALVVILVVYVVELVEQLKQEKIEVLTLQRQNMEAELAVLKSQVDPHFLFNTLATLSSLVRSNSEETISFVDHMADTFRYMLENRAQKVVTTRDELTFLRSYIFMMKKRFEEGLHVNININDAHLNRSIPQFALQIAVENAMKHNIVSRKQTLHIELKSVADCIVIWNNLNVKKHSRGYGIGLDNLAQRYSLMGKKAIKITNGGSFFEVSLPLL